MMRRIAVGVLALATVGVASFGAAGVAAAAAPPPGTLGTLTATPATGLDTSAPTATTSAGCPDTANAYNLFVYGPGGFANGLIATTTSSAGFSTTQSFPIAFGLSFKDIATDNQTTVQPGKYTLVANCVDDFTLEVKGTFTQDIWFTDATHYQSTDPSAPTSTSTGLAASPQGPVDEGTAVTFTASLTPAAATGSVQFKDGANNLGSPVNVAGGTATLNTSALTAGSHSITAVFTGTGNYANSTSQALSYQVNAVQATPTTTALSVNPSGSVQQGQSVTLNAAVSPGAAAGKVQFKNNGQNFGSPVTVAGGSASLSTATLPVGQHSFTAQFVPATGAYLGSESGAVPLEVTPATVAPASENITTTVASGDLVISVDNQNVTLPSPTLLPDSSMLTTAGELNPVTVTDTRAGNPGWNVSGQVTDFADGASHSINGANLGWSPKVIDKGASQTIAAGPLVDPALGIAPGAPAPAGKGLAAARTMATAGNGSGLGTAHLGAGLSLNVPTSTVAGTYTAVLTLTAI